MRDPSLLHLPARVPYASRMIVAGIDEAGYGPLLGPFVVSAAVFRIPDGDPSLDLWEALGPLVRRKPGEGVIPVNDSKQLYKRRGLQSLEEGLFPFLATRGRLPGDLRELLRTVARRGPGSADVYLDAYPWYRERNARLPRDSFSSYLERQGQRLRASCEDAGVELIGLAAVPVEVLEWNDGLAAWENKSTVAFRALAGFLRRLWRQHRDEPTHVFIDRQGGRVSYSQPLFEAVKPRGVRIIEEDQDSSSYALTRGGDGEDLHVTFSKRSDEKVLAVALASMLSKYLREVHMGLFNEFFLEHQSDLRPTAGYVEDGRRFLADTDALRRRLGIDSALLVRKR